MTPRIVIGTVHPDLHDANFTRRLIETVESDYERYLVPKGRYMSARAPAGMLHVARNEVVRGFLAHPLLPKYLVFIDTDMDWTPDDVWRLVESAETHGLAAVNALVSDQAGAWVMRDYEFNLLEPSEDLQQVFCAGMAFMCLRRDELEACGQIYGWPTPWFDYGARRGNAVTEDVIFSQRYHDMGFPIHVDTRIHVTHRKIHPFRPALPAYQTV